MLREQIFARQLELSGMGTLLVDSEVVAKGRIEKTVPFVFTASETFDVGMDLGSTVSAAYRAKAPFPFTGKIVNVTVETAPTQPVVK